MLGGQLGHFGRVDSVSNSALEGGKSREKALGEVHPDGFISLGFPVTLQAVALGTPARPHCAHSRKSRKGTPLSPKMGIKRLRDFRQDGKSQGLICHEVFGRSISPWLREHQALFGELRCSPELGCFYRTPPPPQLRTWGFGMGKTSLWRESLRKAVSNSAWRVL